MLMAVALAPACAPDLCAGGCMCYTTPAECKQAAGCVPYTSNGEFTCENPSGPLSVTSSDSAGDDGGQD
jgi:hypothetical protein